MKKTTCSLHCLYGKNYNGKLKKSQAKEFSKLKSLKKALKPVSFVYILVVGNLIFYKLVYHLHAKKFNRGFVIRKDKTAAFILW